MWRFIVLAVALFSSQILGGEWDSRELPMRCWENTSVTDPVALGKTIRMFCDPCEIQTAGVEWEKEHGTWDKSNYKQVSFKMENHRVSVGRYRINWDMSFSIYDVEPGDAGRYRCSREGESMPYSWHQVIVRDPSTFRVADARKNQRPLGKQLAVETRWTDWSPCSSCDEPGTRERIGFCYKKGTNPLEQYHNGIPCHFPDKYRMLWQIIKMTLTDTSDQKIIEACSITCKEADKQARHKKVQPYSFPFDPKCLAELIRHFRKFVVVYEGDTLRLKCHHCVELYGGVKWYKNKSPLPDLQVPFDWHDNDDENKFALNYDMSMEIRRAAPSDKDKYTCMKGEERYSIYVVWIKERPSEWHVIDRRKTFHGSPYSKRSLVYTMWSDWGPCTPCGEAGIRIRMGYCYSNHIMVMGALYRKYRMSGIPCHYTTSERFPWRTLEGPLLDEKIIEDCNEPCIQHQALNVFASDTLRYSSFRRAGQKNPWSRPEDDPVRERVELKVYGYIGHNATLVCPGAADYAVTEWKNGSRMISPQQTGSLNATGRRGRVHIDNLLGSLHIGNVSSSDEQNYRCYANGVHTATVRLLVRKPLIDVKAFMGSFFQVGNVLGLYTAIFVFVLLVKCFARGLQTHRHKQSLRARAVMSSSEDK